MLLSVTLHLLAASCWCCHLQYLVVSVTDYETADLIGCDYVTLYYINLAPDDFSRSFTVVPDLFYVLDC